MLKENVSIILPTYNRAYILEKSVRSVLEQTYPYFELIIVDDGSTDNTRGLIDSFKDDRIKYYYTEINQGAGAARNYGISKASYEYIAFQDSDDYWHKDKLEQQMQVMMCEDLNPGFVYHKIAYDMGQGYCAILPDENIPLEKKAGDIFTQIMIDNMVACPSLLVKKSCLDKVGGFDEKLKALEDYDLVIRLSKEFLAGFVDAVLLDSTFSNSGVSGSPINYLNASCSLIAKYKSDYISTKTLNHRLEIIFNDSKSIGLQDQYVALLEKIMMM